MNKYNDTIVIKKFRVWVLVGIILGITGVIGLGIASYYEASQFLPAPAAAQKGSSNTLELFKKKIEKWNRLEWPTQANKLKRFKQKYIEKKGQLEELQERLDSIRKIFKDSKHQSFLDVNYETIKTLEREITQLKDSMKTLESGDFDSMPGTVLLTLGWTFAILLAAYLVSLHGKKIRLFKEPENPLHNEKTGRVYSMTVSILAGVYILRVLYVNFANVDLNSTSWTLLCFSEYGFVSMQAIYLGGVLIASYVYTLAYFLSHSNLEPEVNLYAAGTKCGVGDYILFLQTWAMTGIIFVAFPCVFWVNKLVTKYRENFDQVYLLDLAGFLVLISIVVSRFIIRAVSIKLKYQKQLQKEQFKKKQEGKALEENEFPPDPTIGFLGEKWWSLPASLVTVLSAIWLLIKLLGLGDIFLGFLG